MLSSPRSVNDSGLERETWERGSRHQARALLGVMAALAPVRPPDAPTRASGHAGRRRRRIGAALLVLDACSQADDGCHGPLVPSLFGLLP